MKLVKKKILQEWYTLVREKSKTFEIRKDEDDIQRGDLMLLQEWSGEYTGREILCMVTHVLRNADMYGLKPEYCIISFRIMRDYYML